MKKRYLVGGGLVAVLLVLVIGCGVYVSDFYRADAAAVEAMAGSMAAGYAAKHSAEYKGLVLLAAYSTADLTGSGLEVLSLYGSEDGVLNRDKYEGYRGNLPETTAEIVISGGNHAFFGSYGRQDGDGEAGISASEQTRYTAEIIAEFVK